MAFACFALYVTFGGRRRPYRPPPSSDQLAGLSQPWPGCLLLIHSGMHASIHSVRLPFASIKFHFASLRLSDRRGAIDQDAWFRRPGFLSWNWPVRADFGWYSSGVIYYFAACPYWYVIWILVCVNVCVWRCVSARRAIASICVVCEKRSWPWPGPFMDFVVSYPWHKPSYARLFVSVSVCRCPRVLLVWLRRWECVSARACGYVCL